MKRFTETMKWSDPWFRMLNPTTKLFFLWLLDNSDCAGVCVIDKDLAEFQIGSKIDLEELLKELGKNITKINAEKVWMPKAVFFQCGELNENSPPHKGVIKCLRKHELLDKYPYPIVRVSLEYQKGNDTLQDKDKDKDKEKDKEKDKCLPFRSCKFKGSWEEWKQHRKELKKPLTPMAIGKQLGFLSKKSEEEAIHLIEIAIRNGWQGLFDDKNPTPKKSKFNNYVN